MESDSMVEINGEYAVALSGVGVRELDACPENGQIFSSTGLCVS